MERGTYTFHLYIIPCCCVVLYIVSKRWYRLAQASWQYIHHICFKNCFHSFQGKYGGTPSSYMHTYYMKAFLLLSYIYMIWSSNPFTGLSDGILQSVLKRGGKTLISLDLSSSPNLLTKYGLDIIGQLALYLYLDHSQCMWHCVCRNVLWSIGEVGSITSVCDSERFQKAQFTVYQPQGGHATGTLYET